VKTIGILGGMGPVATGEFFHRILVLCQRQHHAVQDGDYPPILLYSMSLQGSNESGIGNARILEREFVDGITKLCAAGCDFVVIPCNTAHYFVERLRKDVKTPIVSIIDLTVDTVRARGFRTVGVLASESAYGHGVYAHPLERHGILAVAPNDVERTALVRIVRNVMGGRRTEADRRTMRRIARRLHADAGIEAVIVGCTELSVVLPATEYPVPAIDAMDALAQASVTLAYSEGEVPGPAGLTGLGFLRSPVQVAQPTAAEP
jgi:aspartate racemase